MSAERRRKLAASRTKNTEKVKRGTQCHTIYGNGKSGKREYVQALREKFTDLKE